MHTQCRTRTHAPLPGAAHHAAHHAVAHVAATVAIATAHAAVAAAAIAAPAHAAVATTHATVPAPAATPATAEAILLAGHGGLDLHTAAIDGVLGLEALLDRHRVVEGHEAKTAAVAVGRAHDLRG